MPLFVKIIYIEELEKFKQLPRFTRSTLAFFL